VWLAYGVTVAVFVANHIAVRSGLKKELRKIEWETPAGDDVRSP
jgi:heme exporter protein D